MQETQSAQRRFLPPGLLLAAFGVLTLAAAATVWTTGVLLGASSDSTPHRLILYSEASASSALTDEQAVTAGFVVVHSAEALTSDVDKSTRAIIMSDPGHLNSGWIKDQYNAGIIIGALNISRDQLAAIVGDNRSDISIPPNVFPEPYVSLASQTVCPNGSSGRGMTSLPLKDAPDRAGVLAQTIETKLRLYSQICTATPPVGTAEGR
jgi:hypothetical protein